MRPVLTAALAVVGASLLALPSFAKPEFAKKEKKACGYCHIKPEGGGDRNPRGIYYFMHKLSFEGYDEVKVMGANAIKKTGKPEFKSGWKIDVPEDTARIGVGDFTGDKVTKLLLIAKDGKASVNKVTDKAASEATVDLGKDYTKAFIGNYAKGKGTVIVMPGAVYFKSGDSFTMKKADIADLNGHITFSDGTENVFYFAGQQPDVYAIDTAADKPAIAGKEMVPPEQAAGVYANLQLRASSEVFGFLGLPEEAIKAGTIGMFDPRAESKLFVWVPWLAKDGGWTIKVADVSAISAGGGGGGEFKALWESTKLGGKVLDVAYGKDPKGGKVSGFTVLLGTGADGKGRSVEFLALD